MSKGTVRAYGANTLTPLWTQHLGIEISPSVQPLLVNNGTGSTDGTLWLVSGSGEVRGLRVNNNGLGSYLNAAWPKAFGDNCNTGRRGGLAIGECF